MLLVSSCLHLIRTSMQQRPNAVHRDVQNWALSIPAVDFGNFHCSNSTFTATKIPAEWASITIGATSCTTLDAVVGVY
jgi:hypothetical protein